MSNFDAYPLRVSPQSQLEFLFLGKGKSLSLYFRRQLSTKEFCRCKVVEVKYTFFIPCFIAPFSTSSFVSTVVFLFNKYLVIIQKSFILHGVILSLIHFKCKINL